MTTETARLPARRPRGARAQDLVRWGPIVAGVVVGLGFFALFDALWFAIAAGNNGDWISGNLEWWVGGTGIAALLVAGFVAGLMSGARGAGAGTANGVTAWGLLVVLSTVGGIPGALGLSGALDLGLTVQQTLWTLFWSLLIGLVSAALGGLIGGILRRSVKVADVEDRDEPAETDERPTTVMRDNHVVDERRPETVTDRETVSAGGGSSRRS